MRHVDLESFAQILAHERKKNKQTNKRNHFRLVDIGVVKCVLPPRKV